VEKWNHTTSLDPTGKSEVNLHTSMLHGPYSHNGIQQKQLRVYKQWFILHISNTLP